MRFKRFALLAMAAGIALTACGRSPKSRERDTMHGVTAPSASTSPAQSGTDREDSGSAARRGTGTAGGSGSQGGTGTGTVGGGGG